MSAKKFTVYQQCNMILEKFATQIEKPFIEDLTKIITECKIQRVDNFTEQELVCKRKFNDFVGYWDTRLRYYTSLYSQPLTPELYAEMMKEAYELQAIC